MVYSYLMIPYTVFSESWQHWQFAKGPHFWLSITEKGAMAMTEPAAGLLMITWQNALQIGVASARTLEIIRTPVCEPLTKVKTVYFACLRTKMTLRRCITFRQILIKCIISWIQVQVGMSIVCESWHLVKASKAAIMMSSSKLSQRTAKIKNCGCQDSILTTGLRQLEAYSTTLRTNIFEAPH